MNEYSAMTPEIQKLAAICMEHGQIPAGLYDTYHVLRGLRDVNGKGVLAGLTDISTITASKIVDGKSVPCEGELRYRGYDIKDLVSGFAREERFGFEETAFLILFGRLPAAEELADFQKLLGSYRTLPTNFVRDVIMKAPSKDMMNTLQRSILTLYSYDDMADNIQIDNVLRQCLQLISTMPMLAVYGYQAYNHYVEGKSFYLHSAKPELSTAENILRLLRPNKKYTNLEARILDIALVLHMDHGGGNNSTFTDHVVTSSGTDTYSAIAASLASLKGPKHGGANLKVVRMFDEMKEEVKDWKDEDEIKNYLLRLLNKEALTTAASSTVWDMPFTPFLTRERRYLKDIWVNWLLRKATKTSSISMRPWNVWPQNLSPAAGRFTKASAPILTFTVDSCIVCSVCRISFSHRCSL